MNSATPTPRPAASSDSRTTTGLAPGTGDSARLTVPGPRWRPPGARPARAAVGVALLSAVTLLGTLPASADPPADAARLRTELEEQLVHIDGDSELLNGEILAKEQQLTDL